MLVNSIAIYDNSSAVRSQDRFDNSVIMKTIMDFMTSIFSMLLWLSINHVAAISDAHKSQIQSKLVTAGIQCVKDYPLSLSDLRSFKNKMIPNGTTPKCFAACLFKKIGIMDDMGKISPMNARENAKQVFKGNEEHLKNVDKIMEECSTVNKQSTSDGNKGCDRAKLAFQCFVQSAPKYGFDFDF